MRFMSFLACDGYVTVDILCTMTRRHLLRRRFFLLGSLRHLHSGLFFFVKE